MRECDFAERGLEFEFGRVLHAAAHQEERVVARAVFALDPAVTVAGVGELEGAGRTEPIAEAAFDFRAEPDDAAVLDGVFEAGVLAVGAVAVVALHEHDFLGDVHGLGDGAVTEEVGDTGEGFGLVVRHAEATADGDVEAGEFLAGGVGDGDEAEVVRVNVHVVARRDGDDGLEFAREIGGTVERLGLGLATGNERVAADPDFVVGASARGEVVADGFRNGERLGVEGGLLGIGVAHNIAVHVAAGREGVEEGAVDGVDGRPEVALEDAVKLEGLARGELERAVGVGIGEGVEGDPLRRRADAAGDADARHEAEGFFFAFLAALVAQVAVVLAVDAVEFREVAAVLGDGAGGVVGEVAENISAEEIAGGLEALVLGERLGGGSSGSGGGGRGGRGTHAKRGVGA